MKNLVRKDNYYYKIYTSLTKAVLTTPSIDTTYMHYLLFLQDDLDVSSMTL